MHVDDEHSLLVLGQRSGHGRLGEGTEAADHRARAEREAAAFLGGILVDATVEWVA